MLPWNASDRFVSEEERWLGVVKQLQTHAYVRHDDMDKFQTEFVNNLVQSRHDIGKIPRRNLWISYPNSRKHQLAPLTK